MPFDRKIECAARAIAGAEYLLIGGGAGLSAAAGLTYSGPRFTGNFADFIERYRFTDLYTSSFYPFETSEELWAYWARHIDQYRFAPPAMALYRQLHDLTRKKPYFILTTNVDGQFQKAGFDAAHIFAVQGDYGKLQCSVGCHDMLYDDEAMVARWLTGTRHCRIPAELVPTCPICGGPMDVNLRHNEYFVEDDAWREAAARYEEYVREVDGRQLVLLELGVGFNTPGIIRFAFELMTYQKPNVTLIRVNRDHPDGFRETAVKTLAFSEDMGGVITALSKAVEVLK